MNVHTSVLCVWIFYRYFGIPSIFVTAWCPASREGEKINKFMCSSRTLPYRSELLTARLFFNPSSRNANRKFQKVLLDCFFFLWRKEVLEAMCEDEEDLRHRAFTL